MAKGKAKVKVFDVDRGLKELQKTLKALKGGGSFVKVGVFGTDSKARRPGEALTNVDLATIHEFGAPAASIPARPFIGSTFEAKREEYAALVKKGLAQVYENRLDIKQVLGLVGAKMATDIKKRVTHGDGNFAPNAPSTLKRKARKGNGKGGEPRPLVDTGRLVDSVTWDVVIQDHSTGSSGGPKKD